MASYLCLSVTFLNRSFHGRREAGAAEWPPSPLRLFQALVAAAAARWQGAQLAEQAGPALCWLEDQPVPTIVSPARVIGAPIRIAVPNNDLDIVASAWAKGIEPRKQPSELKAMKTVRSTHLLDGDAVHYLWRIPNPLAQDVLGLVEILTAVTRGLVALGWGIDLVVGDARVMTTAETDSLVGERWLPMGSRDSPSGERLRAATSGTFDALRARHGAFLNRLSSGGFTPVPPLAVFQEVGYRRATDLVPRQHVAFDLRDPSTDNLREFRATRVVTVAGMIRHAVAEAVRRAGRPTNWINEHVLGHRPAHVEVMPRFSYLPLPTIDPCIVVAGIRRVLISEPTAEGYSHIEWLKCILGGQPVVSETKGIEAILVPTRSDGVLAAYVQSSRLWTTVTPVALPGCDEGKVKKRDPLFVKALRHAGYDPEAVEGVEFQRTPFLRGAEDSLRYRPGRPHHLSGCSIYHVLIRWRYPIEGPIMIGSGRHCGLGLFASA